MDRKNVETGWVREILVALRMTSVTLVVAGVLYPYAVTGIAEAMFPRQAEGSLITAKGRVLGSLWIAQSFSKPEYFHPRPSAAGPAGYDAAASGGSNLGPTSKRLIDRVTADVARLREENPDASGPVPLELVTTSGSGLDPHISPDAARWQAPRVAAARGWPVARVDSLIAPHTEGRSLGVFGEPRVNVLELNLALDELSGTR